MKIANEWTVYRTRFLVRACQLKESLAFIDALGREHSGHPGDYLVESFEGCFRITPRHIFEDVYVPLSPDNGHEPPDERAALDRALCALSTWAAPRSQPVRRHAAASDPARRCDSVSNHAQAPVWSG